MRQAIGICVGEPTGNFLAQASSRLDYFVLFYITRAQHQIMDTSRFSNTDRHEENWARLSRRYRGLEGNGTTGRFAGKGKGKRQKATLPENK
ncbi:hypothetical protein CGRA01v4_02587 [Colletotrichum graminicola]|nr:hypothetical protein CGRA01v4_02587 [Colletotrichum graminicola]